MHQWKYCTPSVLKQNQQHLLLDIFNAMESFLVEPFDPTPLEIHVELHSFPLKILTFKTPTPQNFQRPSVG